MYKVKQINLFICLVFSFIFLFGSIFSVQAAISHEVQTLKQCIEQKDCSNEIVECVTYYTTQNIRNHGERKIIYSIDDVNFRIVRHPWYMWNSLYRFDHAYAKIGEKRDSALIYVSVYRKSGIFLQEKRFDLTFELKVNQCFV